MRHVLFVKIDIPAFASRDDAEAAKNAAAVRDDLEAALVQKFGALPKVEAKLQKVFADRAPVGMHLPGSAAKASRRARA